MPGNTAIGLILLLFGSALFVVFLIARSKPEVDPTSTRSGRYDSSDIGSSVLLAFAVLGLLSAVFGLFLLVESLV